jgi:hypothetical protein
MCVVVVKGGTDSVAEVQPLRMQLQEEKKRRYGRLDCAFFFALRLMSVIVTACFPASSEAS